LCAGHTPKELASCRQTNNPTSDDDDSSLHSDQSIGISVRTIHSWQDRYTLSGSEGASLRFPITLADGASDTPHAHFAQKAL
jgi:hypothetical protein